MSWRVFDQTQESAIKKAANCLSITEGFGMQSPELINGDFTGKQEVARGSLQARATFMAEKKPAEDQPVL